MNQNQDEDEHIGGHYIANDNITEKELVVNKRYQSKFPGNLPPSYSTFNNKTTGHNGVNNINGDFKLHEGYHDHTANYALWGPQKKNIDSKQTNNLNQNPMRLLTGNIAPLKCTESKHKVKIVRHFAFKADKQKFEEFKHIHVQEREEKIKRCKSAQQKNLLKESYVDKSCFGKVPQYLIDMKAKKDEDERLRLEAEKEPPKQIFKLIKRKKLTRSQMEKIREGLVSQQKDLVKEYANFTHKDPDGIKLKRRKVELEQKLATMEKDILKLDKALKK